MAEAGTGVDIIHPNATRMAVTVEELRDELDDVGYDNALLATMTKNDMVYATEISSEMNPVGDRQDAGFPYVVCTGATAGTPGTLTPDNCLRPADKEAMSGVVADPETAWEEGQYVEIFDDEHVYWDGNSWEDGEVPGE